MVSPVEQVLAEHHPRPSDDPLYVPWWAKGEYARAKGTRWAMPDGTQIVAGRVAVVGTGAFPSASRLVPVCTPQPEPRERVATPPVATATPRRAKRTPDRVDELLRVNRTLDSRVVLCHQLGIDAAILRDAPNPGVASMRLANALRRVLRLADALRQVLP